MTESGFGLIRKKPVDIRTHFLRTRMMLLVLKGQIPTGCRLYRSQEVNYVIKCHALISQRPCLSKKPQREKTYPLTYASTKIQISLHIRAVWYESSLSAWWSFASLAIQNLPSEKSGQTARMRRLIWLFAGRTYPQVLFLTMQPK